MRNIFLIFGLVTLSCSCFSQSGTIKLTFYNEYEIAPQVKIIIELKKTENEVKLNLILYPNNSETDYKIKSLDSIINISEFQKLCSEIDKFENLNMKNDAEKRVLKQYCEIEYITENKNLRFKINTQGFGIDERDRMLFIKICEDILRISGLNSEEYIVTF